MRSAAFCALVLTLASLAYAADGPSFEAASVKMSSPDAQLFGVTGGPGSSDPGQFRAPRVSMLSLLTKAFDVETDQIIGPAWLREFSPNYYNIAAVVPPGTTKEQFQKMLQNLLIERFHLVYHREKRDFPGYELVVDRGGPKFKEVAPTKDPMPDEKLGSAAVAGMGDDGFPKLPPGPRMITMGLGTSRIRTKYQEQSMATFVADLGKLIGPVQGKSVVDGYQQPRIADHTGLTGTYSFMLECRNDGAAMLRAKLSLMSGGASGSTEVQPSEPSGGAPNIFDAVQKQLGLRLDKITAVPLDVIVIESVDKVPTEN